MGEWISVKDRMPHDGMMMKEPSDGTLVFDKLHGVRITYMHSSYWNIEDAWGDTESATHWMPLPEPPEQP